MWLLTIVRLALAILAVRGRRWAYVAFMILGFLYFPIKSHFTFDSHFPCELTFGLPLAIHSLRNFPHIILFAVGFVLTAAQFRLSKWLDYAWAATIIITFGLLVEILEGVTRQGNCRMRDLIPDAVGSLVGAVIVIVLYKIGWRPKPSWSLRWRHTR
jgi:hypothetical protein